MCCEVSIQGLVLQEATHKCDTDSSETTVRRLLLVEIDHPTAYVGQDVTHGRIVRAKS